MNRILTKYSIGLLSSIFFLACAQQVAPTGGERDVTAPKVIQSKPENQSINFNSKSIELEFDEFIKLNNLKEQLIVSPPLKYNLQTKIIGKTLKIEIKDTLKENTTYVFNFGNAIVDLRENNPIPNFQYVFSTGSSLDSLEIEGNIVDAFNLKASQDMLVMLYEDIQNDSAPLLTLPTYVGKSDKQGAYKITNIKEGSYRLFALKDANSNFLYDRPDEIIAFKKNPLKIEQNLNKVMLYSFQEDAQKQFIENQTENEALLILDFKKKIKSFNYAIIDTTPAVLLKSYLNESKDSAFFWWKQMPKYKMKLAIFDDTLFADTIKFKIDSLSKELKLKRPIRGKQNYFSPILLSFTRPVAEINLEKVKLYRADSTSISFQIKRIQNKSQNSFLLSFSFEEDSLYKLNILPRAFIDIYKETTDTINYNFSFNKAKDFGSLEVKLNTKYKDQKLIQLIDSKGNVVQEEIVERSNENNLSTVNFDHLKNGSYSLKFIMDWHRNKLWDAGNYLKRSLPERVVIFNEKIDIRANWDKEIEWIIK